VLEVGARENLDGDDRSDDPIDDEAKRRPPPRIRALVCSAFAYEGIDTTPLSVPAGDASRPDASRLPDFVPAMYPRVA
jgi:hypothetical protein